MAKNQENGMEREEYFKDRAGTVDARFHAVPHDEKGWAVKKEGQDDPELTTDSRSEAVSEAKRMAEDAGTMAYIHDKDGRIEDQFKYNN
ncbi:DUF2188 domain-containing protein [Mesobacillus selenatarsenatis]|uniref:DUF2188 domain-containing protein n=1 Tax=Mesobacillus selenatarsenatis (strain DSM 18680 / JCM 14380 / FERM P-15431 / SF-1) TaxID=1321606 RepID=A0A0A8X5I0_MESS1|nr:DUF2188 domain-containing protein [Mesobacillus selenatarsenatis]GAM14287.1 hypothetical protein SAMD00020551_2436 [Mesobacillus selenatarsenatis SF-1]